MIRAFFDLLAKMGLSVRDDPPKVVDLSLYTFGESKSGLALAIRQVPRSDPDALPTVSIVIRNVGQEEKSFNVPGWLNFYQLQVLAPDGTLAPLTPFGRAHASQAGNQQRLRVSLAPGAINETEVPLGSIFSLRPHSKYSVNATCEPYEGASIESNRIALI